MYIYIIFTDSSDSSV